mmetsp:Transcript_21458/g.49996  ORF Transcript_21458/g.49996 Transcript_21458/m.49996 type:complete len:242 (+) Transcript_21458:1021-1746(+)
MTTARSLCPHSTTRCRNRLERCLRPWPVPARQRREACQSRVTLRSLRRHQRFRTQDSLPKTRPSSCCRDSSLQLLQSLTSTRETLSRLSHSAEVDQEARENSSNSSAFTMWGPSMGMTWILWWRFCRTSDGTTKMERCRSQSFSISRRRRGTGTNQPRRPATNSTPCSPNSMCLGAMPRHLRQSHQPSRRSLGTLWYEKRSAMKRFVQSLPQCQEEQVWAFLRRGSVQSVLSTSALPSNTL